MRSKKVSKVLQYPGVRIHHFYIFEGEEATKARSSNWHVMVLVGLWFFDIPNGPDVIWSSSEAEDLEAAMRSVVEATS